MLNRVWAFFVLISLIVGFLFHSLDKTVASIFDSGESAVKVCLQILPGMCFFCGLLKIAEASGITRSLAALIAPLISKLFPDIPKNHPSISMMVVNILSNIFGMGNAATAFGVSAMKELQNVNPQKDTASRAMCMFIILNTCTLALFPTNIISLRFASGSSDPAGIMLEIIVVSAIVCVCGVIMCKIFSKICK